MSRVSEATFTEMLAGSFAANATLGDAALIFLSGTSVALSLLAANAVNGSNFEVVFEARSLRGWSRSLRALLSSVSYRKRTCAMQLST